MWPVADRGGGTRQYAGPHTMDGISSSIVGGPMAGLV
jgi:hypothetical protein